MAKAFPDSPYPNGHTLSPDDRWLAIALKDGATTNIWAMPTDGGPMRRITELWRRAILIARTASWSSESRSVYAAVAEMVSCFSKVSTSRPSDSFHRVSTLPPE